MKNLIIILLLFGLSITGYGQDRGAMREKIEAQKVAFFTSELDLTPEESQAFWPVYNSYAKKREEIRKQFKPNIRNRDISEEEANEMISSFFERQEKELELSKMLYADLREVLPASKIVKIHIAERKFKQRLIDRIGERRKGRKPGI